MKLFNDSSRHERFNMSWLRQLLQGAAIFSFGSLLVFASALNPNAVVMSARSFSWLPLCGMVILAMGLLECLDAALAREQRDFFQNLQVGVLDAVVGGLILFSVAETPERVSLMIAAFLVTRGIVRIALTRALRLPNSLSTSICGGISLLAGLLVFAQWPSPAAWFIALCLSFEIASRGWAMMMFSFWVRKQQLSAAER